MLKVPHEVGWSDDVILSSHDAQLLATKEHKVTSLTCDLCLDNTEHTPILSVPSGGPNNKYLIVSAMFVHVWTMSVTV